MEMTKAQQKWNLKRWKKELWKVFSEYIRMRDKGKCFSCQKILPPYYHRSGKLLPGWKSGQAGHFVTAKNCGLALYFHERNIHCQCHHCNINLSGNWLEYRKAMIKKYGLKTTQSLEQLKWTGDIVYSRDDYYKMLSKYKKKVEKMIVGSL